MRRTSKSDPHRRLLRALLEMAGPETEPIGSSSRSWASVTFTGAQHEFELFLMGKDAHDRANKLAECLPEAEFVVAGHIVVDATVDRSEEHTSELQYLMRNSYAVYCLKKKKKHMKTNKQK